MKTWFASPPCNQMEVKVLNPTRLELHGPAVGQKIAGGIAAAFGASIAAFAAGFLKAPSPAPFKIIPLVIGAAGGAVSAAGAFAAISRNSVLIDAKRGATFRWKPGPLEPRELVVKAADIEGVEVVHQVETHHSSDHFGSDHSVDIYRLTLVTRDARALPIERFSTHTQASLRLAQIESLLGLGRGKKPRASRR
ncbi:MAG: hypothetical protein ACYC8T_00690 [Myxococcaceae bacterium]